MSKFKITRATKTRYNDIDFNNLRFGVYFSDHIYVSDYKNGAWNDGEIIPYGPFEIEPAMCTLHYGQALFEGLKAFRSVGGGANLFRPEKNAERLNRSAERICIPTFDIPKMIDAMIELGRLDQQFIPKVRGNALYYRPVAFGSGNFLGVHESDTYRLIIMTSPVGSYYPEGLNPIRIKVCDEYVRAVKGGTGAAKVAGNYAASLLGGRKARAEGFSQVLWLDGHSHEFVDEVGAMNIMFVIDDELITPSLDSGTILAGVTRDSVLTLAREWGMKVSERGITVEEVLSASNRGKLQEVFGTGTAAVISPVGLLGFKGKEYIVNDQKIGPVAQKFYDTITGIQYGEIEDTHGWINHFEL
jgi:branched-chain amino acid aminotransferase